MMKSAAGGLILALAMMGPTSADQGKPKEKAKPEASKEQPAPQPPADKGQVKGKKDQQPTGPGSSSGVAGGGSCAPDTTAPVIASVSATPSTLGAPNHKMTPVSISAKVTDNCSTPTWTVTAIASNEPTNGTGDGDTEPDWTIAGAHGVSLRAERAGTGSGRTYTITITAKDAAGNTSTGNTTVSVPHNR